MTKINELSNKTLNNYINKTGPIVTKYYTSANRDDAFIKKAGNRITGRHVARKKIQKTLNRMPALESVEETKMNYNNRRVTRNTLEYIEAEAKDVLKNKDKYNIKNKNPSMRSVVRAMTRGKIKKIKENIDVSDLLQHAIDKQPIEFYEVMNSLLADKIEPILVNAKQEMAKDIFKTFEEPVTEEKEEDEPSDVKGNQKNKRNDRFNMKKKFKEKLSKKDRNWD